MLTFRATAGIGAAAAFGALAFAYYLQFGQGLEPCPLCIFQRVAMFATGVVFAIGALHSPAAWGRGIYAGVAGLAAAVGGAIAGRHVWLQSIPEDQVPACGPGLDYLMDVMPWQQALAKVLRGDAACATIDASFLGLSLPGWTLVGFAALLVWAVLAPVLARDR